MLTRRDVLKAAGLSASAVALSGLLAACTDGSAASPSGSANVKKQKGGTLRVGLTGGSSSDTLNPFFGGLSAIGTARAQQLFQPLVQLGQNAQSEYVLAESITPDGSTSKWTIKLRKGVTWHDGKPFVADDVIYTLRTILDPQKPLGGATVLSPVDLNGITKVDDLTVSVPMTQPFGSFVDQMASFWYFLYIAPNGWKDGDPINGTGPFKYKSFTPGQQSVFVKNTNYWKSGLPYLDSVSIIDFQDASSVVNALTSHSIDATGQLTGSQIKILKSTQGIVTVPSKTGAIEPFTMRVDTAPFNNVDVRQAMRYLVDRQQMIDTAYDGYAWAASDVTSPYDVNFDKSLVRHKDVAYAKKLLKKAGYDGDLKVTLDTSLAVNSSAVNLATLFKQQAAAAGVTVTVNQVSPDNFFGPNYYTKVPFTQIYYNYSPYLAQVAQTFLPTSPFPETHFNNPTYTNLYNEANATTDKSKLHDLVFEMQKIDFDQGGYIIPCFVDSLDAYSSKITGYQSGKVGEPMGNFNFEDYALLG
jgi:peptide/nickel transport system substrate-binding protein